MRRDHAAVTPSDTSCLERYGASDPDAGKGGHRSGRKVEEAEDREQQDESARGPVEYRGVSVERGREIAVK